MDYNRIGNSGIQAADVSAASFVRRKIMANKKGSRQLQHRDRLRMETMYNTGHRVTEIACYLGVHRSTVYNELKRGSYIHRNTDWTEEKRYSSDLAQRKYEENLKKRGTQLKIGNDIKLANFIEDKIVNEDYSPDAVIGELTVHKQWGIFSTRICTKTLYNYIDKGIFLRLTNKNLPVKGRRKRKYHHIKRQKRAELGTSIEKRPQEVNNREEFGHWEMDSVLGARKKSKNTLLTITERKTRNEIIFKLPDHSASAVISCLDQLEGKWGKELFRKVFKTITVDNGTEFSNCEGMERSVFGGKRTKVYYCHAYSSWERGTNEVTNKLARRKVPKGSDFDNRTNEEIKEIEKWMNHYPRRIHGYRTAGELFQDELLKIR